MRVMFCKVVGQLLYAWAPCIINIELSVRMNRYRAWMGFSFAGAEPEQCLDLAGVWEADCSLCRCMLYGFSSREPLNRLKQPLSMERYGRTKLCPY